MFMRQMKELGTKRVRTDLVKPANMTADQARLSRLLSGMILKKLGLG